jgi:hypothetical protein
MKNKSYVYCLLIFLMGVFIAISSCKQKEDPAPDPGPDPDPTPGAHGVIMGSLTNGVTLQPIANGLVLLVNGSGSVLQSVTASGSGTYTINNISDGNYQVKVQATGFKEMVADSVVIGTKNPKGNFVGLCPVETSFDKPVSALSGLILDKNNLAIANATVSIAADPESLTNGYFSSVLTDSKGQFIIPAIPLVVGKATIPAFKLRVMKDNYQISYSKGIVLTENRMKVRNFSSLKRPLNQLPTGSIQVSGIASRTQPFQTLPIRNMSYWQPTTIQVVQFPALMQAPTMHGSEKLQPVTLWDRSLPMTQICRAAHPRMLMRAH